jgi:DNA-binding response OmpR family regulator
MLHHPENHTKGHIMTVRILYVDDDEDGCEMICVFLHDYNPSLNVTPVRSAKEALKAIAFEKFDIYIIDNWLGDKSGVQMCREIRITDKATPIILFSGVAGSKDIKEGLASGADEYLLKPNDLLYLGPTIEKLLVTKAGQVAM